MKEHSHHVKALEPFVLIQGNADFLWVAEVAKHASLCMRVFIQYLCVCLGCFSTHEVKPGWHALDCVSHYCKPEHVLAMFGHHITPTVSVLCVHVPTWPSFNGLHKFRVNPLGDSQALGPAGTLCFYTSRHLLTPSKIIKSSSFTRSKMVSSF